MEHPTPAKSRKIPEADPGFTEELPDAGVPEETFEATHDSPREDPTLALEANGAIDEDLSLPRT